MKPERARYYVRIVLYTLRSRFERRLDHKVRGDGRSALRARRRLPSCFVTYRTDQQACLEELRWRKEGSRKGMVLGREWYHEEKMESFFW
jgi:hypothetical protein